MLCSAEHEIRNVAVSESNRLGVIGDHRGQKSIYSWHYPLDDRGRVSSRVQMLFPLVHFAPLELHSDVLNSKQSHGVVHVLERVLLSVGIATNCVRAHRHHSWSYGPHVQVVDGLDSGNRLELSAHDLEIDVPRRGLEENIDRVAHQLPRASEYQC